MNQSGLSVQSLGAHAVVTPGVLERPPRGSPQRTLEAVLSPLPVLGVRRLIRLMAQLAAELDAAHEAGIMLSRVALDNVRVERHDTPFERARLPLVSPASAVSVVAAVRGFGLTLASIVGSKPLFLDVPGAPRSGPWRRRSDADIVQALARGLDAIARRCARRDARYRDTTQLRADLEKLGAFAERMAELRQPTAPVVAISYPKAPRTVPRLPKVVLRAR